MLNTIRCNFEAAPLISHACNVGITYFNDSLDFLLDSRGSAGAAGCVLVTRVRRASGILLKPWAYFLSLMAVLVRIQRKRQQLPPL